MLGMGLPELLAPERRKRVCEREDEGVLAG